MAKIGSFVDQYDDVYPSSYWRPVQVNVCKEDKNAHIIFYGFESEAKKGKRSIGQKSYSVGGEDFDTYFGTSSLDPEGKNPYAAAYTYADNKLDKDSGQVDEDDKPIMVSFFDGFTNS